MADNTHESLAALFGDIADSIRAKTGQSGSIKADEFPSAIDSISTGSAVGPWDAEYDDNKLRVFIELKDPQRLTPYFRWRVGGSTEIDWGDGNIETLAGGDTITISRFTHHSYSTVGRYIITISTTSAFTSWYMAYGKTCGLIGASETGGFTGTATIDDIYYLMSVKRIYDGLGFVNSSSGATAYGYINLYNLEKIKLYGTALLTITAPGSNKVFKSGSGNLKEVIFPDNITIIGKEAFAYQSHLQLTSLPSTITSIGASAFTGCVSLMLTSLPSGITTIGASTFSNCQSLILSSLPNEITTIGNSAFYYCQSLTLTQLPSNLTSVGTSAFDYCTNLALTSLPAELTSIPNRAFAVGSKCMITDFSNVVGKFGQSNFSTMYVEELKFGSGLTAIDSGSFCTLPNCLKIDFTASTAVVTKSGTNTFSSLNADCKIVVPDSLYDDWIIASNWSAIASYIIKESEYSD